MCYVFYDGYTIELYIHIFISSYTRLHYVGVLTIINYTRSIVYMQMITDGKQNSFIITIYITVVRHAYRVK